MKSNNKTNKEQNSQKSVQNAAVFAVTKNKRRDRYKGDMHFINALRVMLGQDPLWGGSGNE